MVRPIMSHSVEFLLESTISSAQCHARCLSLTTTDQKDCLTVCPMVQANPSTSLCMFPTLCTGGCQAACQVPDVLQDITLVTNLAQQSCQLALQVDQTLPENVVFIVAGSDQAGMWSLMFSEVTGSKVELTREMTARFVEVTLLAVNSKEVVDKATIDINQVKCTNNYEHIDEQRQSTLHSSAFVFHCISLIILIVILIILIGIIFLNPRHNETLSINDDDSVGDIINDAFLPCAGDFELIDYEQEKNLIFFF